MRATIGFGFITSDWLKNLNQSPSEVMQNQSNSLITFDTHLNTSLMRTTTMIITVVVRNGTELTPYQCAINF